MAFWNDINVPGWGSLPNYLTAGTATQPAPGTLAGGPTQSGSGPFGAVPTVPDPAAAYKTALETNIKNLDTTKTYGSDVNAYNLAEELKKYSAFGLDPLLNTYRTTIGSELSGQVPQDVIMQLVNQGAERGITTGSPGSPNMNAAYMRALGLTSLDLQKTGASDLTKLFGMMPTEKPYDITKDQLTGKDMMDYSLLANYLKAAPDPTQKANWEALLANMGLSRGNNSLLGGGGNLLTNLINTYGIKSGAVQPPPGTTAGGTTTTTYQPPPGSITNGSGVNWDDLTPDEQYFLGGGGNPAYTYPFTDSGSPYNPNYDYAAGLWPEAFEPFGTVTEE